MKRLTPILALATLVLVPAAMAQPQYGWTISNSQTDPNSSVTSAPAGTVITLYLWLECTTTDGCSAAEFDVTIPAGNSNFGFNPASGWLNAGDARHLLLVTGCAFSNTLAGSWNMFDLSQGEYCLVASEANNNNVSVDCTVFGLWINTTVGFSNTGQNASCFDELCGGVDSVEQSTWGSIKGLYR